MIDGPRCRSSPTALGRARCTAPDDAVAGWCGIDTNAREVWVERARRVARDANTLFLSLASTALDEDLEVVRDKVARLELVLLDAERSRVGARRAKVFDVLVAIGARLASGDEEAFTSWLVDEALSSESSGGFPDIEVALVDDANRERLLAAARAVVSDARKHGRRRVLGEHAAPSGSAYAVVNDLLRLIPDGAGGNLAVDNEGTLRQLVGRLRKERVTGDVARCCESRVGRK